jgi:putative SOS response-associated peptidase YedK
MPSMFLPENEDRWLPKAPLSDVDLKEILAPFPAENMGMYPVPPFVNSPATDDERIIRPMNSLANELTS